ncbi:PP2C family serine/threonine-protein phosphatase [Mucilaginibacter sp. AK015]|uniref:PP2C family protein-serine/threonine phosphatase n=1 Tax=Mucilaginibacter sp. AK015 TaxID=2723072 RepID=UPI0016145A80|nr:protein phosphatase 2C domain-containing protein [Mucilaginibacter sp. AK015]MBB5394065.1 serine/threonine protein phosphatase PrpC [Mucilaginibacter sp. AK015]
MAENYFGLTDTGKVRSNNEDAFIAQPVMGNRMVLVAVIDGVGGYNGGEVAAAIAKEVFIDRLNGLQGEIIPAMIDAFKLASQQIADKKLQDKDLESMACVATMALVDIENNQFFYAHVGDTRLYLLRDNSLVKISKDHSFVGFLEDSGRLTETAAMNHPKRNEINKALGFTNQIDTDESFIETGQSPFLPGDMLLLCSDGLTDMVDKAGILNIITQSASLQHKATELIAAANANGGNDNVTVALALNDKPQQRAQATMPAPSQVKQADDGTDGIKPTPQRQYIEEGISTKQKMGPNKNTGLILILSFLCLLFLASTIWLYLTKQRQTTPLESAAPAAQKMRNADEIKLQDAIDAFKGDTLVLSDTSFKQPIVITDTLHIDQDTLYIKVKGNITLQRDTAFNGPALSISTDNKVVMLENLKFKDFNIGAELGNSDLMLKNVQFINCKLHIQRKYKLMDSKPVTANFPDTKLTPETTKTQTTAKPNGTR